MICDWPSELVGKTFVEKTFLGHGQAEMAFGNFYPLIHRHAAEALESWQRCHRLSEVIEVTCSRHPVEDHADDIGLAIEEPVTQDHGGGGSGPCRRIPHQNHRQTPTLPYLRRAGWR